MEASTTINKMLAGNKIFVPTYQRAYSWDTKFDKSKTQQHVNVFLQPDNKFPNNCIFVRKELLFLYLLGCFIAKA